MLRALSQTRSCCDSSNRLPLRASHNTVIPFRIFNSQRMFNCHRLACPLNVIQKNDPRPQIKSVVEFKPIAFTNHRRKAQNELPALNPGGFKYQDTLWVFRIGASDKLFMVGSAVMVRVRFRSAFWRIEPAKE